MAAYCSTLDLNPPALTFVTSDPGYPDAHHGQAGPVQAVTTVTACRKTGAKSGRHDDTPPPRRWSRFKPPPWGQLRLSRRTVPPHVPCNRTMPLSVQIRRGAAGQGCYRACRIARRRAFRVDSSGGLAVLTTIGLSQYDSKSPPSGFLPAEATVTVSTAPLHRLRRRREAKRAISDCAIARQVRHC